MRVIAGLAKRTVLTAPEGQQTRPTADRVKENLFNIISPYVRDAVFLDLFCGSGAIGIEALSRGAGGVVFVDNSEVALNATKVNLTRTKLTSRAKVLNASALAAVAYLEKNNFSFDIIFMDPPYGQAILNQTLDAICNSTLLRPNGILIIECSTDTLALEAPLLALKDMREYGGSRLVFFEWGD